MEETKKPEKKMRETTEKRHEEIFAYYEELLSGYGDLVHGLSRAFLYQQVADRFHYSVDRVLRIVNNMSKRKCSTKRPY